MSAIQKTILLILHHKLVSKNLFYAANHVWQVLLSKQIPNGLNLSILRIHLFSYFNLHLVETYFHSV
ncbi:MAG: hypothetical protein GYA14_15790 [Ignavibacteria bacterium]|nr:hypothetical protein [Ignavibacteria bacterium]